MILCIMIYIHIIIYEQFVFISSNLVFYKKNNAKFIVLIIFLYFLIIIIIIFVSNSNFAKERRIYGHISCIIIHIYVYLHIFI